MSDFTFSAAARKTIRAELRAYIRETGAYHVDLIDETTDTDFIVEGAGIFRAVTRSSQLPEFDDCSTPVCPDLMLLARVRGPRSVAACLPPLEALAERLYLLAVHARVTRLAWIGLAQSWRCDDIGRRFPRVA